ncbi:type II toxin-antitoxin system RelE/ParE family toxin [Pseudaminobacter sp. 19-2017]|uniref:Type II toxin-antitoxin system RelE/ParE family toxin n=1 Tax=Pseudaminobacter soli (ex Zhang et al. 2022) TaxID=2831468 RepID=A0A942E3P7_9HYPH|nr:type II toxin-antitoxin system RelE/ParE family toxin [Pseudaminobacter soli]MBS3650396.1 type II toxin-antitoxin system RelE/ParE family toxin [Pseudaminobacter soli]
MKVRLLRAALRDLQEVQAYIAAEDPEAASRVIEKIQKAVDLIAERPQIGRPASPGKIREWSVPRLPYVIPYRISGEFV